MNVQSLHAEILSVEGRSFGHGVSAGAGAAILHQIADEAFIVA
jgi:hypothetical protein